jgi:hypothetical protein
MRFENRIVNFGGTHVADHLSDDQLMEICVLAGDNPHLAVCRSCKLRFDEVVRSLQQMHDAAVREADHAFTAERLHDQRDRIMRRIERHDHPAEVVVFPHPRVPAHPSVHRMLGPARRWVASAAAAGLAAGVFLGFTMDRSRHVQPIGQAVQQSNANGSLALQAAAAAADDLFFIEIDEALVGSRAREMRPDLDAIDVMTTPLEIREVSYVRE